jgi:2-polyprenyl-3-methyl-5-hydroxy-6-metoxy-1,4-benzoquinol methylase
MDYDYKDYWKGQLEHREEVAYYENIYGEIKHLFKFSKGDRIIDVGGGNGQMLRYLGVKKATVIDISSSGLNIAGKLGYKTIKSDIRKRFPISDGRYDIVLCLEVLEHLEEPSKTLCEIQRILKLKGILYLSIPNMKPDGVHHKTRLSLQELEELLNRTGFITVWLHLTPKFKWTPIKDIMRGKKKFKYAAANMLSLIPGRMKRFMTKRLPNVFAGVFICKCKRIR